MRRSDLRYKMDQATSTSPFTRAAVHLARAELYSRRSETASATAYFDSARVALEAILANPYNPGWRSQLRGYLGEACAGLGLKEEAIRHGRKAVELLPVAQDAMSGPYMRLWLAEICAMVGEYDLAIDELEYLLSVPCVVSPSLVRVDPIWDPLREDPRFQRLLDKYPAESS
jgi:tetratricopeptide (TPR) repeat protein